MKCLFFHFLGYCRFQAASIQHLWVLGVSVCLVFCTLISPSIAQESPAIPANTSVQAIAPTQVRMPLLVVNIYDESDVQPIRTNAAYFRDIEGTSTIESVSSPRFAEFFRQTEDEHPNFGYTSDKVWIRVTVRNTQNTPITRIFDAATTIVDSVILYQPLPEGGFMQEYTGNAIFIDSRTMKRRRAVFTIELAAQQTKTFYLCAYGTNPLLFNLVLYTQQGFTRLEHSDFNFYGFVWGILWCMILFNSAMYLATLNRLYFIVVLHLLGSLGALTAVSGVFGEFLWFDIPRYNTRVLTVCVFVSCLLSLLFSRNFCNTALYAPRLDRIILGAMGVCGVFIITSALGIIPLAVAGAITIVVIVLIIASGYMAARRGSELLRFSYWVYICSWALCNASTIFANFVGSSFLPEYGDFFSAKLGTLAGAVQIVMECFALGMYNAQAQRRLAEEKEQRSIAERERELEHERNLELAEMNTSILRQQEILQEQTLETEQANTSLQQANSELVHQRELLEEQKMLTERMNAELQEKLVQLAEVNNEKNEFLGIAAHDLKNPLTGLKGMIEILRSGDDIKPGYLNRMALTMAQSVDRMFEIVRNLLDVNAIEQGAIKPNMRQEDLLALTKSVCDSYRLASANKRITIEFKANASEIPCLLDEGLLRQIADNLVSNAVKYSPRQTTISVRTLQIRPHTDDVKMHPSMLGALGIQALERLQIPTALLVVRDQGPGLTEEDKSKLFQKFARLSAQPTGGEHSTGLGLSIAKRLVESMNGQIWCESSFGNGAVFVVAFPLEEA